MAIVITEMQPTDFKDVAALCMAHDKSNACAFDATTREGLSELTQRNATLSLVARDSGVLVGVFLCGRRSIRGYLQHMVVDPEHRDNGLQNMLVNNALRKLQARGIHKCRLELGNAVANRGDFWDELHWKADAKIEAKQRSYTP